MKFLLKIFSINAFIVMVLGNVEFTALNDSPHVLQLYRQLHNEDAPLQRDREISHDSICENINESGFFQPWSYRAPNKNELQLHQNHSIFGGTQDLYTQTVLEVMDERFNLFSFKEYVFTCWLQDILSSIRPLIPYYVSKEYNVVSTNEMYKPGRFIFANLVPELNVSFFNIIFAENPASVYIGADFNVELHYQQIRKYIQPAKTNDVDPLCRLISDIDVDPENQHYRICVAISRSSYYKNTILYPEQLSYPCHEEEVSLTRRTENTGNVEEIMSYRERMTRCKLTYSISPPRSEFFYISRGYLSNTIFVYRHDLENKKLYLDNLSINISIVDELNSFDFLEHYNGIL